MSTTLAPTAPKPLTSYRPYWAKRFGVAPFLPTTRAEMDTLGWDSCDVVIVTGDAYVDHPSFGMAVIGRTLEAQGFRVGIIAQPDWHSAAPFAVLGKPNLFFGVTAGNMDSMINRYTADRRARSDDAYTPGGAPDKRPDRCSLVYTQRCREAFGDVPILLGGIEASLRRIAHYDYWQDKVRRAILVDAQADLLLYGNAERALIAIAHRLAAGEPVRNITDVRGTAFVRRDDDPTAQGWFELDSSEVDLPGRIDEHINPYLSTAEAAASQGASCVKQDGKADAAAAPAAGTPAQPITFIRNPALQAKPQAPTKSAGRIQLPPRERTVIRLPSFEQVKRDGVLYAHANRVLHLETNPGNARALVQQHEIGGRPRDVWINPPPIPLATAEMDHVFDLPYARSPHPVYADEHGSHDGATRIPAWEMIRFSVNIMRVRLIQNFFRCARQNKLVHHLATQVAWVFDLAVELAVRERARTAFTKLHIGLGLQQVLAPQAPGVLRALTHRLTALQHDGLEAHLRQDHRRKNAAGAKAHDHGALLHLRGCGGHRVVGHVGAGADVGVACKLGEQVGFPCGGYIHVNDIDPKQCRFACVKTALEYREVCDVSRRDAQGLGDQRRQGLGRVVQRELEFGQANHG